MKNIFIRSAFLVASTLLATHVSQAKSSFPAHFVCTTESGVTLEGNFPEMPKLYPVRGQEETSIFLFNGVGGAASYSYMPNCFISRAGKQICYDPNEIQFDLTANVYLPNGTSGTEFQGTLAIYDTETFLHIDRIEPSSPNWWHENGTCTWN